MDFPFAGIKAEDLEIPAYQPAHRAEDGLTQNIIENFDPQALGVLLVSHRNGENWVIDGQRRRAACLAKGYTEPLPCYVFEGLTEAREAQIWKALDVRSNQHVIDRYRAMVTAGTPRAARQIDSVLRKHGYLVDYKHSATAISAVKALEILYLWGALPAVLTIIRGAWAGDDEATAPNLLMALGAFDYLYHEFYIEYDLIAAFTQPKPAQARAGCTSGKAGRSL